MSDGVDSMDDVRDRVRRFLSTRRDMGGLDADIIYAIGLSGPDGSGQTLLRASDLYRLIGDDVPADVALQAARYRRSQQRRIDGGVESGVLTLIRREIAMTLSEKMLVKFVWEVDDGRTIHDNVPRDDPAVEWKLQSIADALDSTVEALRGSDPALWLRGRRVRARFKDDLFRGQVIYRIMRYYKIDDEEEVQDGR